MRKKNLLLAVSLFCTLYSFSRQTNEVITGKVIDNVGKAYKSATVVLHRTKDSSLVKTDITDMNGGYGFANVKAGSYFVAVTAVGFAQANSVVFNYAEGQPVSVAILVLSLASKELKGVVVSGKKPLIEVKADKVILNVDASINATGSNAMELLQKSPGVIVDKDDNISLKGKTGVQIYIDGRPSQMGTTDLAALLRSMNSADIESIEMISNPSAKFEASGSAGIINIKLKKDKRFGVNGNVSVGVAEGKTLKSNNSVSLNYRNKKANWFGNYSNSFGKNESYISLYRIQADSIYDQHSLQPEVGNSHNFKVGTDITLNKKSSLGFIVNGNIGNNFGKLTSNTPISAVNTGILNRTLVASNLTDGTRTNFNFNANYHFADSTGHDLSIDANYGPFKGTPTSYQPNQYYYPNGTLQSQSIYRNYTPSNIDIYTFKVDYEQNLKKGKLGYGGKFSQVVSNNTFDFWDVYSGGDVKNLSKSNSFKYTENVNAVYVNLNNPLSKTTSLQAGLRVEQTNSHGVLTDTTINNPNKDVPRNYLDFFPSAAFTYTPNFNNQLTFTYSRRIDRPSYQNLNPFENKLDELTYQKGNPFLNPQYSNSFEVNHLYKYKLSTTLGFSHVSDLFAQIMDTTAKTKTFFTTKNLATQNIVSLTVGTPFSFFSVWNGYLNVGSSYSHYEADFGNGKTINLNALNYTVYAQNSFNLAKLSKGLTAELSGFFTGPSIYGGTFKSSALGSFDIGLQKMMMQGKATLKLSLTDVAKTMHWHAVSGYSANVDVRGGYESRQLRLNFSYRFGSNTVKAPSKRNTGAEDENKRLNGGSGGIGAP